MYGRFHDIDSSMIDDCVLMYLIACRTNYDGLIGIFDPFGESVLDHFGCLSAISNCG